MSEIEVRKLPKKTIIIIVAMCLLGVVFYILMILSRELKMSEILVKIGYTNTKDVTVYNVSKVLDEDTNKNGTLYKIRFNDLNKNQECFGLVFKNSKGKYEQDLDCK